MTGNVWMNNMSLKKDIDLTRLPAHIAVIMDGNGRWAKQRELDRFYGHQEGVVSLRKIVEAAGELKINYLTVYTFSTENWNRPQKEVDELMALLVTAVRNEMPDLMKNEVRVSVIGDMERLPQRTRENLNSCVVETSRNSGLNLVLALSYSSRWELTKAVKEIAVLVKEEMMEPDRIDEKLVEEHLTTKDMPDPDLLIRTGGERRISNYLLWQLAYAELYFTDKFWPDFREEDLYEAIVDFQQRERRFGKTSEQLDLN